MPRPSVTQILISIGAIITAIVAISAPILYQASFDARIEEKVNQIPIIENKVNEMSDQLANMSAKIDELALINKVSFK
ncbi:MAG: hypothetical protein KGL39_43950 [Patescibacteria group bacterium]|nr:hypothetical protein [Patescibacteria group bacterium]